MIRVRVDTKLDNAINKGLAAAMLVNVSAGIKVMIDEGVPLEVVTRVLLDPQRRRATDWKHQLGSFGSVRGEKGQLSLLLGGPGTIVRKVTVASTR